MITRFNNVDMSRLPVPHPVPPPLPVMSKARNILITSALPYANGPIHLGHLVEYVQSDIWARFQRLRGHCCYFVCADDAHGTPIMLRAAQEGISPEQLIERVGREHRADFDEFLVHFDHYHSTHSPENQGLCEEIYRALRGADLIEKRSVQQAYDPEHGLFLPDRYIRGSCPRCGADDQYGDNCEVCGATYAPTELGNPRSVLSGACPEQRESEHYFFRLPALESVIRAWVRGGHLQREVVNKLEEWFQAGLRDWDISRDAPYFGFRIPDIPEEKYFYVWMDAPIGYFAAFLALCRQRDLDFDAYCRRDTDTEMYHFIGKDIVYFHGLFWPAMLHAAGYRKPSALFAHGFLTVNGRKMSKTRGTFITARTYLGHLHPEYLRYYLGGRLDAGVDDIDLNMEDFRLRVNSDLVGKFVNIASRCAVLLQRHCGGRLAEHLDEPGLFEETAAAAEDIAAAYEAREYARATRTVMRLADRVNQYLARRRPWELARRQPVSPELRAICTTGLNCFRQLAIYLAPVLPATAERVRHFLKLPEWSWEDAARPQLDTAIRAYEPLHTRVTAKAVAALLHDAAPQAAATARPSRETKPQEEGAVPTINMEEFSRLELRVARITKARMVPEADRLLRLELELGEAERRRTVLAGIRTAYRPEDLEGRLTVLVANLEPRKMRFGLSEGMVLAAGDGGEGIFLLSPDSGARPGMRVR